VDSPLDAALLPIQERVLGPEHPDTLDTRGALAYWTGWAGDTAGAKSLKRTRSEPAESLRTAWAPRAIYLDRSPLCAGNEPLAQSLRRARPTRRSTALVPFLVDSATDRS
jgi:hypothetical protein